MGKPLPEKLAKLIKEAGLTERQATWDCHGTPVVLHKACEKIAAMHSIVFDEPKILESNAEKKICVVMVTGHMKDKSEWSIGEAAPYNNKNTYPFAMAEKRAKDRVILKLMGLHGDVYSQSEADEFQEAQPKPLMDLDTSARVDAALEFYETCSAEKFEANEKRFQNLLNSKDITEPQFQAVVEAHQKRKMELMI
tara:strand:- start:17 stop:601 length:585 start_codon:yes stop_codon:yes gene_type:complete